MKRLFGIFVSFLFVFTAFAADPAEGLWKSVDDKTGKVTAIWQVYQENGTLFGKIAAVVDYPQDEPASACKESYKGFPVSGIVNKMTVVGTPWIFNMKRDSNESEGSWKGGNVIDPGNGKMYGCVMQYVATGEKHKKYVAKEPSLAMAGTLGPIKVFQYWIRATEADIKEIQEKFPAKNAR